MPMFFFPVKDVEQAVQKAKDKKGDKTAEYRIRKTQHTMLLKKLVDVMSRYNAVQESYRDKCKDRIQRQLEISEFVIVI